MLHIEQIFDEEGIQRELEAYSPLVPDGRNLKAEMPSEYGYEPERREALRTVSTGRRRAMRLSTSPPMRIWSKEHGRRLPSISCAPSSVWGMRQNRRRSRPGSQLLPPDHRRRVERIEACVLKSFLQD